MKPDIEIKIVKSWPQQEIVGLYKAGGWWKSSYDSSKINDLIQGSFAFAVIIDKKTSKAIGMGRIISDGVSDAYIQDLVILKKYRNLGIGKKLVKFLIDFCKSKKITWLALIAEPDQDKFYEPLGFKPMNKYIPMKYANDVKDDFN